MTGLKDLILQEGLKKDFLVRIMRKLGYYHSGLTKGELIDTLVKKIEENDNANGDLVSLDMGLKNMSLARFSNEQGKKPTLIQWFKRDLESGVKASFHPLKYSHISKEFITTFLIEQGCQTLVFERQRYRTGGSSNVLESTLKTNTIEAMLCMGVSMHNLYHPSKEIQIHSVSPGMMVDYWQSEFSTMLKQEQKKSKEFRVSLTLQMLRDSLSKNKLLPPEIQLASPIMHHRFELSDTILDNLSTGLKDDNIKKEWDHIWKFKSLSRKLWELVYFINRFNISPYTVPLDKYWWGSVKGDDLADSLLHGLAYSEYIKAREDFRKNVKEHGQINSYR